MSRTDDSVPTEAEGTVASGGTPPRVHVGRLQKSADEPASEMTAIAPGLG